MSSYISESDIYSGVESLFRIIEQKYLNIALGIPLPVNLCLWPNTKSK